MKVGPRFSLLTLIVTMLVAGPVCAWDWPYAMQAVAGVREWVQGASPPPYCGPPKPVPRTH
jgi:hypothetical protein